MVIDPDLLLGAYAIGVFPMSDGREAPDVYWVEPRRRAIIPLDGFHLSRSLRKTLRSGRFTVTRDRAFPAVVHACAEREDTWINAEIEASYLLLHERGAAHSIEVWSGDELAGGLYGVRIGGAFFGESMFSRETDASKVALAWLVARLVAGGFRLLDCQFMTPHLRRLGAIEIDQQSYLQLLGEALGAGSAAAAAFDVLDRLLDAAPEGSPPGWVIAQLIGQTS
ncbi:MAG: leucyl/phenylalanyl-tRNA--protein transferase [Sphingomonas sp.]